MVEKNDLRILLREAVAAMGFVWVGYEYIPSRHSAVLRVYIDKKEGGGITVDDCARVSRHLGTVLQVADSMRGRYFLEVSSPGINRPLFELEQYRNYIGSTLKLRLHTDSRLLSKLAMPSRFGGDAEHRTAVYTPVHEDSSTASTLNAAGRLEFGKKSIEGQKNMRVVLRAVGDSDIVVARGEEEFCVPFSMIKRANLQTEE